MVNNTSNIIRDVKRDLEKAGRWISISSYDNFILLQELIMMISSWFAWKQPGTFLRNLLFKSRTAKMIESKMASSFLWTSTLHSFMIVHKITTSLNLFWNHWHLLEKRKRKAWGPSHLQHPAKKVLPRLSHLCNFYVPADVPIKEVQKVDIPNGPKAGRHTNKVAEQLPKVDEKTLKA